MTARTRPSDVGLYWRLLREARPYWLRLGSLLVVSLTSAPLALLAPVPLKMAVDSVLGTHAPPGLVAALLPAGLSHPPAIVLAVAAGLLIAVSILKQLQELAVTLLRADTGEKLLLAFRTRLFRHVQRLSLGYHDIAGPADAIYRIQSDARAIQALVIDDLVPIITSVATLCAMVYVTARLDGPLAILAMTAIPVLFFIWRASRRRLRRQSWEVATLESSVLSIVQEVLGAVRVVKAFGQEEREESRFRRRSREGAVARLRLVSLQGGFGVVVGAVTALGAAIALVVGIDHVRAGQLTLGELLLIMSYLSQLSAPVKTLSDRAVRMQAQMASAERAFALLDELVEVAERPDARPLARATGRVAFRRVSFGYAPDRPVLHDVSFEVEPGTQLGIVGATGAGKTTLVNLLSRFYDPTAGEILLDGVDLRDYRLADLRHQLSVVLQEPVLFSTSVAENIAYSRPGASEADIVAAAAAANAHDFIVRLPHGYQTLVGERGLRLSGGERQRISLARAFLKDAPILVLDEPTGAVDEATEVLILEAMERLVHGRTTFLIAHRASTLARCNAWLRIEDGRVAPGHTAPVVDDALTPLRRDV